MEVITYSLLGRDNTSNNYYKTLEGFTEEVIKETSRMLKPIITSYRTYTYGTGVHNDYINNEIILDLLILATLSHVYSKRVLKLNRAQHILLKRITELRKGSSITKPGLSYIKGILSNWFLKYEEEYTTSMFVNLKDFQKMIMWLEASGEFTEEVKRLKKWEAYFYVLNGEELANIIKNTHNYAVWFEHSSKESMGTFTSNVDPYLRNTIEEKRFKEDRIFCGRNRVEYHLNMVGSEIMNKLFRKDFLNTDRKILLLPICMTSPLNNNCMSKGFANSFCCEGCSKTCEVRQLVELGKDWGFSVMVVPHESSISSTNSDNKLFDNNTGVVGVACVLNLISGGGLLKDMNVPAQCILLDYCGCKNHWHKDGIVTGINFDRLKQIIRNK